MAKLTDEDRKKAMKALQDKVENAIGDAPKGLNKWEVLHSIIEGVRESHVLEEPK